MRLRATRIARLFSLALILSGTGILAQPGLALVRTLTDSRVVANSLITRWQTRTREATVGKGGPLKKTLSDYPDYDLIDAVKRPVSPNFVVDHRSSLNGRNIQVKGVVVAVSGGLSAKDGVVPTANANPQPRMSLASTNRKSRDRNYDLTVLLSEDQTKYRVGAVVIVTGVVEGNRGAVLLRTTN